jgi:hypothetical protein
MGMTLVLLADGPETDLTPPTLGGFALLFSSSAIEMGIFLTAPTVPHGVMILAGFT